MATIEARGYVNKLSKHEGPKGAYAKFDLAVKQKRKGRDGKLVGGENGETLYFKCIDFNAKDLPSEGDYVGVTGYVTLSKWDGGQSGQGGVNVEVSVQSYEKLEQKARAARPGNGSPEAPPNDPFALSPEKP